MTRQQIIDEARTWIGTPFHHQGRVKGVGVDCIGLILGVAWALGIEADIPGGYSRQPNPQETFRLLNGMVDAGVIERIPVEDAQPGDFVFLKAPQDTAPRHFAWVSDHGIIHAQTSLNKAQSRVVETALTVSWRAGTVAAYRIVGVE